MKENIEVLLVDIGNSSIKTTEVIGGHFKEPQVWSDQETLWKAYQKTPMMISSVRKLDGDVFSNRNGVHLLTHQTPLPIKLNYDTPETLGADRIAAAVGANELFPDRNNVIVDLGTCMTIDLIDDQGVFRGGVIAPGLKSRMQSMTDYTDKLPDIREKWDALPLKILGTSTETCLLAGSFGGIVHEIKGIIATLEQDFTSLNMILTGGDAHFFESNIKAHIFAGSKIVQKGLYRIWKYQQ